MKSKIAVLLSCWNGVNYIEEQIDSVLNQDIPDGFELYLYIRDDGSSDATLDIVEKYINTYPNIILVKNISGNLGAKRSFRYLVENVLADFYFFCDQDDVWHKDKVNRSLSYFTNNKEPQIFFSNLNLVDAQGNDLQLNFWEKNFINSKLFSSWQSFLTNSFVTGCTVCFNNELKELYIDTDQRIIDTMYHDQIMSVLAAKYGKLHFSEECLIDYRIHQENSVGNSKISILSIIKKIKYFLFKMSDYIFISNYYNLNFLKFIVIKFCVFLKRLFLSK